MMQWSSSSVHSSTQRQDTSELRWHREASQSLLLLALLQQHWTRSFFICGDQDNNWYVCPRKSTCPLCDGSEPFCYTGAGLPDDQRGPDAAGGRGGREAPQRRLSQPRLPAAAPHPWHEPGERAKKTSAGADTVKHTHAHTERHRRQSRHADIRAHLYCHRGHAAREEPAPPLPELRKILYTDRKPVEPVNQVWPNLYMGDE